MPQAIEDAERRLEETYLAFPPPLVFTMMSRCLANFSLHILHRLCFTVMYHKALVLLHLRHMLAAGNGEDSLTRCINAALKILDYQSLVDAEFQPGGTLCSIAWKINSTLMHDFLATTSVLCHCLCKGSHDGSTSQVNEIKRGLRRSLEIWRLRSPRSHEARKAVIF